MVLCLKRLRLKALYCIYLRDPVNELFLSRNFKEYKTPLKKVLKIASYELLFYCKIAGKPKISSSFVFRPIFALSRGQFRMIKDGDSFILFYCAKASSNEMAYLPWTHSLF